MKLLATILALTCAPPALSLPLLPQRVAPDEQDEQDPPVGDEEEEEKVYSGPQAGEKLMPFKVVGVYDERAGKELDYVTGAAGKPLFLIFVHKLERPSMGLVRVLTHYAADRKKDEEGGERLVTLIVWLDEDRTAAREYLTKARRSLGMPVEIGISVDGGEGPGSYGLNRKVALTMIVASEGKVTANFALVQPNDTDAAGIAAAIAEVLGEEPPTKEELAKYGPRGTGNMGRGMTEANARLRRDVAQLRSTKLTEKQVERIVNRIEKYVGEDKAKQADLGTVASIVVTQRDFESAWAPSARPILRGWAKKFGPPAPRSGGEKRKKDPDDGA